MPDTSRCPSCGGRIDAAASVCAACGFAVRGGMVRRGAPAGTATDTVFASIDGAVDGAVDGRGSGGWAPAAPSPPSRVSAPSTVTPPPSQVSVDGLTGSWSGRFTTRSVRAATTARSAKLPAVGASADRARAAADAASAGRLRSGGAGTAGASPRPSSVGVAGGPSTARALPESMSVAAARARERQHELRGAAVPDARSAAGFDQVLGSDFRADSAISGADPRDARSAGLPPRSPRPAHAPLAVAAAAIGSPWWHEKYAAPPPPAATRGRRPRAPRPGLAIAALALIAFAGLIAFTGYAQHWSGQTLGSSVTIDSQAAPVDAPAAADLAAVRARLGALAGIVSSPTAQIAAPRPARAAKAHRLWAGLITWRDSFALSAHQTRVLNNAIAYANALSRWLKAPGSAARHVAVLGAWQRWRSADPTLRTS